MLRLVDDDDVPTRYVGAEPRSLIVSVPSVKQVKRHMIFRLSTSRAAH